MLRSAFRWNLVVVAECPILLGGENTDVQIRSHEMLNVTMRPVKKAIEESMQ